MTPLSPKELSAEELRMCFRMTTVDFPQATKLIEAHISHLEQELASIASVHKRFLKQVQEAGIKVDLYSLALQKDLRNTRAEVAEQEAERLRNDLDQIAEQNVTMTTENGKFIKALWGIQSELNDHNRIGALELIEAALAPQEKP